MITPHREIPLQDGWTAGRTDGQTDEDIDGWMGEPPRDTEAERAPAIRFIRRWMGKRTHALYDYDAIRVYAKGVCGF